MPDELDKPATKEDINSLESDLRAYIIQARDDIKADMNSMQTGLIAHMESTKDQILRAFQMAIEDVRKESVHIDEMAALDNRITRIEEHLKIGSN